MSDILNHRPSTMNFPLEHMMDCQRKAIRGIYMMIRACNIQMKLVCLESTIPFKECGSCVDKCEHFNYKQQLCAALILCATPNDMISELNEDILIECNYKTPIEIKGQIDYDNKSKSC